MYTVSRIFKLMINCCTTLAEVWIIEKQREKTEAEASEFIEVLNFTTPVLRGEYLPLIS